MCAWKELYPPHAQLAVSVIRVFISALRRLRADDLQDGLCSALRRLRANDLQEVSCFALRRLRANDLQELSVGVSKVE